MCVAALGLVMSSVGFTWHLVPSASADTATQTDAATEANSPTLVPTTTNLFVVPGSPTVTIFRAKVTEGSSGASTPTGSIAFTINDSDPLDCDGLPTDSVPMTGGVATCRVSPAIPPSGSSTTVQATYSSDANNEASGDTLTADDGNFASTSALVVTPPASIPDDCSSDAEPALLSWLTSLPQGTASSPLVLKLPEHACYEVDETLELEGMTDTVINGQGTVLEQATPPSATEPMVDLWEDTSLTIENLSIEGAYDGTNGGPVDEGDYGLRLEGNSGVSLIDLSVSDIQGDFVYLSPPYDLANDDSLNTNVSITSSAFTNAGYHGLTVESVNGLVVSGDVFNGMGTDAMDFEYDDYSTPFNDPCPTGKTTGCDTEPFWAAQDNIEIENNWWINWSADWFVSDQGQTPGVQQQNVTLTGNTLDGGGPLIEIVGTDALTTTAPYLNNYLSITDNQFVSGYYARPYRGGTSVASSIYNVSNLFIEGNTFPICAGVYEEPQPASTCGTPAEDELDLFGITNGTIIDNDFAGALGILQPQPYDTQLDDVDFCGNAFGFNGSQLDAACPSGTG